MPSMPTNKFLTLKATNLGGRHTALTSSSQMLEIFMLGNCDARSMFDALLSVTDGQVKDDLGLRPVEMTKTPHCKANCQCILKRSGNTNIANSKLTERKNFLVGLWGAL